MDRELVIRAQRGDQEAFASIVVAVGGRLHGLAHRILAGDLDAMVDSLRLGSDAPLLPFEPALSEVPPATEEPIPSLSGDRILDRDNGYLTHFDVYANDGAGVPQRSARQHDWVLPAYGDWWVAPHGMASERGAAPSASLRIWSVERVYLDPCHWRTSAVLETPERVAARDALAQSLSAWWGPDPDEALTGPGYLPAPSSPMAGPARLLTFPVPLSRHLDLEIPDLDLADCDDGEYRIWEDHDGSSARTAQPGERISLRIAPLPDGVVVLEAGYTPDASDEVRDRIIRMLNDSAIFSL